MNISIYGCLFLKPLMISLEKDGHKIIYDQFSENLDVVILENIFNMYKIYEILKEIKKNKIKLINIILDIQPHRLEKNWHENTLIRSFKQIAYNFTHKNQIIRNQVNFFTNYEGKNRVNRVLSLFCKKTLNTFIVNRVFYQMNYRNYLKKSDLNLSISKFTQKSVKRLLKVDSEVFYWGVNSQVLSRIPKSEIKYDAINISRIIKTKRQTVFVEAAKKLGLNVIVIGKHQDKTINFDCPHFPLKFEEAMEYLMASKFYVDPSILEGFGLTPVEAAFLNKPTIASNTYVHREILGDYPLYFKSDSVEDLVEKMKMVINGEFTPKKEAIEKLKEKYNIVAAKKRFLNYIKSIL